MVLFVRPDAALARVDLLRLYLVAAFEVLSQAGVVPAIFNSSGVTVSRTIFIGPSGVGCSGCWRAPASDDSSVAHVVSCAGIVR